MREEGFSQVFDALVGQARETGLVKDRLRLKDASHVVASIAVRNTLALVAQVRDRLLKTAEPFDAEYVAGQRIEVDQLRQRTKEQQDESRLSARVTHLQELVAWGKGQSAPSDLPSQLALANAWEKFQQTLTLAKKILQDREPKATRKTLSIHDTEARRKGVAHHAALRKLATRWNRILFRVWKTRTPYDPDRYLNAMKPKIIRWSTSWPPNKICN